MQYISREARRSYLVLAALNLTFRRAAGPRRGGEGQLGSFSLIANLEAEQRRNRPMSIKATLLIVGFGLLLRRF